MGGVLLAAALAAGVLAGCGTTPPSQWQPAPGVAGGQNAPDPDSAADPSSGPTAGPDRAGPGPDSATGRTPGPDSATGRTPGAGPATGPGPTTVPADSSIPRSGDGSFDAASGVAARIGIGTRIVAYRVEVERGIDWGDLEPWTAGTFANRVDGILAASRGWTESAFHPVTDPSVGLTQASWSFRRVGGENYDVRIRLATPQTVDTECGRAGLDTAGVFSCRFGKTIMINLRRWLRGADGYPVTLDEYQTAVVNHEMGHFLGFDHMGCGGQGQPAPVMALQTTNLDGCLPNPYPFDADGRFVTGPWRPS
jgi:hypothetical protein